MTAPELVVRGGTVVTPQGRRLADVHIVQGRILKLSAPGGGLATSVPRTIDAAGLLVLPGFVDTHVHLMEPGDGSRESFAAGSEAAAASGVTTLIEHTHGWPVTSPERLEEKRAHLRGRSYVDYGLAAHAWTDNLDDIPALWRAGVAFFKVFTCETHGVPALTADLMQALFSTVAEVDARCLVHCEDDLMTAANERLLRRSGRFDGGLLSEWRSREAELVAVGTTGLLAGLTGAAVTVAHASNPAVLDLVGESRGRGASIVAESCPQYLTLWEREEMTEGALRKFTPPARIRSDADEERMWSALTDGGIGILSTDHAPSTLEQKADGDIWDVHFGLPGLDTTSSIMVDAALNGRISMERLVEIYSAAPARRYALAGKGVLAPGFDADLVLIDPNTTRVLRDEDIRSRAGWTPFRGRKVAGSVVMTLVRGAVVIEEGRLADGDPIGAFAAGGGAGAADARRIS